MGSRAKRVGGTLLVLAGVAGLVCLGGIWDTVGSGQGSSEPSKAPALEAGIAKPPSERPRVVMETTLGRIVLELDRKRAPVTVANFLRYTEEGFYDGTLFHRVIPGFMIQGGGLLPGMKPKPTRAPIRNEAANGLKNRTGTIAMARTSAVDSATSQFFINCNDNHFLDHRDSSPRGYGYAVFGRVVEGMEVVRKIEKVPTGSKGPYRDVPLEDVRILSVRLERP